jgi:hypothetical protein
VRTGFEEADPKFAELRRRPVISVGPEGPVDTADHLAGPAGPLGGDSDQCPMISSEVFMAIDVAIPLVAVGAVLIAFVLDDQLVLHVDQVHPADRPWSSPMIRLHAGMGSPARTRHSRSQVSRGESTRSRTSLTAVRAATMPRPEYVRTADWRRTRVVRRNRNSESPAVTRSRRFRLRRPLASNVRDRRPRLDVLAAL